jgi:glucose/arabinose dehydrogenase
VEPLRAWTPTIGISGLDYYGSDLIPGWRESLLVTSLIGETLWRLELLDEGTSLGDFEEILGDEYGRLRDVMVAPDGTVYVATSNRDGRGQAIADDDRILKITPPP